MLEKFDNNLPPADDALPERRRRRKSAAVWLLAVLAVLAGAGALFVNESAIRTVREAAAPAASALRRHFAGGFSMEAISHLLAEIRTGKAQSRQHAPDPEATATLLYTVELKDGGRVEGRSISFGKDTVTVTDEMGVSMEVARERIARITTMPL